MLYVVRKVFQDFEPLFPQIENTVHSLQANSNFRFLSSMGILWVQFRFSVRSSYPTPQTVEIVFSVWNAPLASGCIPDWRQKK